MFMATDVSATLNRNQATRESRDVAQCYKFAKMETVEDIRRMNLRHLVGEMGSVRAVADALGKSSAQISQWLNASPDSKTGKPRNISAVSARDIEEKLGKPRGWFDQPLTGQGPKRESETAALKRRSTVPNVADVLAEHGLQARKTSDILRTPFGLEVNPTLVIDLGDEPLYVAVASPVSPDFDALLDAEQQMTNLVVVPLFESERAHEIVMRHRSAVGRDKVVIHQLDVRGSMGPGYTQPEHDDVIARMTVSRAWLHRSVNATSTSNLSLVTGYGDSMEGTFSDGDVLLVDRGVTEIKLDAVYVLAMNDELFIKRIQRRPDGTVLMISDNSKYPPVLIQNGERDKFQVLGRVLLAWNAKKL